MRSQQPAILVTGASGGLSSILVDMLTDEYKLVGVDPRPMPHGRNFPGTFHQVDYAHRKMTDVFRKHEFHALLHLGRVATTSAMSSSARYRVNVLGTRNLLLLAKQFGIKNIVVFSTFHVYGAHQHNHLHIREDEPLRASQIFPELVDAIELDNYARTFSLQHPDTRTFILRPVNVIGSRIRNEVSTLLRSKYCPILWGFDPMMQFIHESDVAQALMLALKSDRSGVYNVAGEGVIPYTKAVKVVGGTPVPVPHVIAYPLMGMLQTFGLRIPPHLMDYFRYPVVVTDHEFRKHFDYSPKVSTLEALKSLKARY